MAARGRLVSMFRRFSSTAGESFHQELLAVEAHAAGTTKTWKSVSFFVAVPVILFCTWNAYTKEMEHKAHAKHDFQPYDHLRRRTKPFPWGDGNHSLFHNSHANALPDGYEGGH